MYFFRLKNLLAELQTDPANDGRTFKYFFAMAIFLALLLPLKTLKPQHHHADFALIVIAIVAIKLIGVLCCYKANGGKNGRYFFHRLFPLSWVMFFRIALPLFLLLIVIIPIILNLLGINFTSVVAKSNIIGGIDAIIIGIIYWWFIAAHIKFLAKHTP